MLGIELLHSLYPEVVKWWIPVPRKESTGTYDI